MAKLIKILRGKDFGMSKEGGNGYAYNKAGKLVIHDPYYYTPKDKGQHNIKDWSPGGSHYKYFDEEYGITFSNVKVNLVDDRKKYKGMFGYVEVTMDVHFSKKEKGKD